MENKEMIIKMLESEKIRLQSKKNINLSEIEMCDMLIGYYVGLEYNLIHSINEERENLNNYNSILNLIESIPSQIMDKLQPFISENNLIEKTIEIQDKIDSMTEKKEKIKHSIMQNKKKKRKLIQKNIKIDIKLSYIDECLDKPIEMLDEKTTIKKLSHKIKK